MYIYAIIILEAYPCFGKLPHQTWRMFTHLAYLNKTFIK